MTLSAILLSTVMSVSPSTPQALAGATNPACSGVPEADRGAILFVQQVDIDRVTPLKEQRYRVSRNNALPVLKGSVVYVRAAPGMTVASLQRIADCHAAVGRSVGSPDASMAACPLYLPGAQATVRFDGRFFVVEIRAEDRSVAEQVLERSQAAAARAGSHGGVGTRSASSLGA